MKCKKAVIFIIVFLFFYIGGSAMNSEVVVKKPVKISHKGAPVVLSSQKVLESRSHLLQSPGTVLDSTEYDWQDNGSLEDRIAIFDDGGIVKINAAMMWGFSSEFPNRAMHYYHFDGTGWNTGITDLKVFGDKRNGFGSLTQLSDGSAVIVAHGAIDDGTTRAFAAVDAFPGIRAFSFHGTTEDPDFIWPIATTNSDGSILMAATYNGTYPPGTGLLEQVGWTRAPDRNSGFVQSWSLIQDVSPDWMDNDCEWPSIASGTTLCGMAITDLAGPMRYYESDDFGISFTETVIATADTAGLGIVPDSTAARLPWMNSDIMYVYDEPHIVWSTGQGISDGGEYGIIDFKATIFHWSPSTGVDTVVVAETQSVDNTRADYVATPWNHLSADWPSIGLAVDGQTIVVVFLAFNREDIDSTSVDNNGQPGVGYLDIQATFSGDNGNTWSEPVNVTNPDGSVLEWDDRYPSIAKINLDNNADPGKDVYMIYQSDDLGGTYLQATEGSYNYDYIKFMGIDLDIPPPELLLTGPTPGIAGVDNTFEVSGATPGARIHFLYGFERGAETDSSCEGIMVAIDEPIMAGSAVADGSGSASLTTFIPDKAGGKTVLFQSMEKLNCKVSNLVEHRF
jgi:hypothetical protein